MTSNNKERGALNRLAEALVDDILKVSDEEVLAEFKKSHGDPEQNAADMRAMFETALIAANKEKLHDARSAIASRRGATVGPSAQTVDIAAARETLRRILDKPDLTRPVTVAARKESEMSDADVVSMLEDLEELDVDSGDERLP